MKVYAAALLVLVGLAVVGLPVAGWGALLAIVLFAFGGLAACINADGVARTLFTWGAAALVFSIVIGAVSAVLRAALDTPEVQLALFVGLVLLALVGLGALAVKLFGGPSSKIKVPKFPVRERVAVVADPVHIKAPSAPGSAPPTPGASSTSRPARSPAPTSSGDLGIFRRRSS